MIFHGNLGIDPIYNAPELTLIGTFFPITLELVFPAIIVAVLLGIFTGAIAASRSGADEVWKRIYQNNRDLSMEKLHTISFAS